MREKSEEDGRVSRKETKREQWNLNIGKEREREREREWKAKSS